MEKLESTKQEQKKIIRCGKFAIHDPTMDVDSSFKAFILKDFRIFKLKNKIKNFASNVFKDSEIDSMDICWKFQKNKGNGQHIKYTKNKQTL